MHCDIYKFSAKPDWYAYIARPDYPDDANDLVDALAVLPNEMRQALGRPSFVMHLDLESVTTLAQADKSEVAATLAQQGYYMQIPPKDYDSQPL